MLRRAFLAKLDLDPIDYCLPWDWQPALFMIAAWVGIPWLAWALWN